MNYENIDSKPDGHCFLDEFHGYIYEKRRGHHRCNNSGYVKQHILVLEKKLGRALKLSEDSHHINGVRSDNKPENLEAILYGEHQRQHGIAKKTRSESGFRWVYKAAKGWQVLVKSNKEQVYGGFFNTPIEAAQKADQLAFKIHGNSARFNLPSVLVLS